MAAMLTKSKKLFNVNQQQLVCYYCCMVLLVLIEAVLRNLWSHSCISNIWLYSFVPLCKLSHGSHIEPNQKLFNVHQLHMLCNCSSILLLISVEAVLRNLWSHTCISNIWMYIFVSLCKLSHSSHIEPNQKLFDVHQLQMLCYCSSMVLLISVEAVLRNLWSHTYMSNIWMYSFLRLCKLSCSSHIEPNQKIVRRASTTDVVLL